jgi:hypothetical protein
MDCWIASRQPRTPSVGHVSAFDPDYASLGSQTLKTAPPLAASSTCSLASWRLRGSSSSRSAPPLVADILDNKTCCEKMEMGQQTA